MSNQRTSNYIFVIWRKIREESNIFKTFFILSVLFNYHFFNSFTKSQSIYHPKTAIFKSNNFTIALCIVKQSQLTETINWLQYFFFGTIFRSQLKTTFLNDEKTVSIIFIRENGLILFDFSIVHLFLNIFTNLNKQYISCSVKL